MFSTTFMCTVVLLVLAAAFKQEVYKLPPEKALAAHKFSKPCAEQYNLDSDVYLTKLLDGSLSHEDEISKKYLYCFTLKGGFIKEDGHMVVERIAWLLGNHSLVEEFKEALRDCNKETKENHLETVMAMNACINNTAPVIFSL